MYTEYASYDGAVEILYSSIGTRVFECHTKTNNLDCYYPWFSYNLPCFSLVAVTEKDYNLSQFTNSNIR